ncbi:MAG: class II aldolase/adducin family protein [Pseudomonadota bacterium]
MMRDTSETRYAMIEACLWMNRQGLNQGTSGNISVAVEDGVLITPSGVPYDDITPDTIVKIGREGPPDSAIKPSTEWPFHQRLHQVRPDMPVVLHSHPPYCSAVAVQRRGIPACHYMVAVFGGSDVPLADYDLFGSEALAHSLADCLKERHGCLMANHGATVLGETIERAKWRLEELENLARTFLISHIGGEPVVLSDDEMAGVLKKFADYGPR